MPFHAGTDPSQGTGRQREGPGSSRGRRNSVESRPGKAGTRPGLDTKSCTKTRPSGQGWPRSASRLMRAVLCRAPQLHVVLPEFGFFLFAEPGEDGPGVYLI